MTKLLAELIEENTGKVTTIFLANGFQLHGVLLESDEMHLKIRTSDYGSTRTILVNHSAISTLVPGYIK